MSKPFHNAGTVWHGTIMLENYRFYKNYYTSNKALNSVKTCRNSGQIAQGWMTTILKSLV